MDYEQRSLRLMGGWLKWESAAFRNAKIGGRPSFLHRTRFMTISPELAVRRMALIKADQRRQKAIWQELRELRASLRPIDRAWSDTRLALKQYERDYTHVVPQLQEREAQLLDEMRPFLRQIDALEKEARRLDRKIRKAQQASERTPAGPAGSTHVRLPALELVYFPSVVTSNPKRGCRVLVKKTVVFWTQQKRTFRDSQTFFDALTFASSFQRPDCVNESAYRLCAGLHGRPTSGPAA